jgi:GT2 family glycosyltransferase
MSPPLLAGLVVHWHNEPELRGLLAAWPDDPRFELVVVDNGSDGTLGTLLPRARYVRPEHNLGFAGGVNTALAASSADLVLLLNPDAHPEPGALDAVLAGFAAHPEAAGIAPRLEGEDGRPQHRWQLRPLPSVGRLLLQAFFVPGRRGPAAEPTAGAPVAQPAAGALAVRRAALAAIGGMDERFHPAWFEDVDLARRLRGRGERLVYWPDAVFRHGLGASVARLGYERFLWIYNRNLTRYLAKHHGRGAAAAARALLPLGAFLRLAALPLRRPRRAASRARAARALVATALGALSGWRAPARLARDPAGGRQ